MNGNEVIAGLRLLVWSEENNRHVVMKMSFSVVNKERQTLHSSKHVKQIHLISNSAGLHFLLTVPMDLSSGCKCEIVTNLMNSSDIC